MRFPIAVLSLLFITTACSTVKISEHTGASDYEGSPKRIFIVNQLDASPEWSLSDDFAAAIVPALMQCKIAASIYRPNPVELDAEAKIKTAVQQFKPDAVLGFHLTFRLIPARGPAEDTYTVKLYDATQKRDVWHGEIRVRMGFRKNDVVLGAFLADQLLRTLTGDKVIKTCPPFPPEKQT